MKKLSNLESLQKAAQRPYPIATCATDPENLDDGAALFLLDDLKHDYLL